MRPSSKRTRSSADLRVIFASASSSTPRLDIVHSTRSSRGCIFLSYFPPPRDDELHHDLRSPPLAVPTPISALTRTAQRPCNSYVRYPVAPPSPICCYCGTLEHISRVRRRLERELRFYGQRDLSPVEPRYASQYFHDRPAFIYRRTDSCRHNVWPFCYQDSDSTMPASLRLPLSPNPRQSPSRASPARLRSPAHSENR